MFKRQHYVILSLVLVLVLIAFNLPSQTATHLKLALGGLFLPLFGLAGATQNLAEHAGAKLISRGALENQLSELRRENQRLQFRVMQDAEAWRENDQLRRMLAWQKQAPWKLTLARVIAGEPANWWRTLHFYQAWERYRFAIAYERGERDRFSHHLMDLIGIDVNFSVTRSMYEQTFGEPRYRPHVIQQTMVNAGLLGRKTKRGFYKYPS